MHGYDIDDVLLENVFALLTTDATSSPQPMTDFINKTTAMPAVLWTDWINSSTKRKGREENV